MKCKKVVVGEYDENGYSIYGMGGVLYSAGANAIDSQAPGRDLSLKEIRKGCIRTGKELAAELGAVWCGVERVEVEV